VEGGTTPHSGAEKIGSIKAVTGDTKKPEKKSLYCPKNTKKKSTSKKKIKGDTSHENR